MSSLEKNLYKRVQVEDNSTPVKPVSSANYRGISTVNPENPSYRLYDFSIIKQDIINHFHIRQGEKLENPEFGTIIWDLLWEPLTEALKQVVAKNVEDIINYDPRVTADRVVVDEYENGILIECTLVYLDYSIAEQLQMKFDKENGLLN